YDEKLAALLAVPGGAADGAGRGRGGRGGEAPGGRGGAPQTPSLPILGTLTGVMNSLQGADVPPTANQLAAISAARTDADAVLSRWTTLRTTGLATLNATLKAAGLGAVEIR
ncbi:MAG TPA: hypothetical protein VNM36_04430, partial [Gemmatimonadaceae bacterium]|nr:hypothetical protein [Gemmatimonadaceae bacterium]